MINFGSVPIGAVLPVFFDTFAGSTGASITMTGIAVTDIEIYKGTSMTQRASDAGYTLLDTDGIDVDGVTGIQGFSIDTGDNTDAGFYASGSFYTVVVSSVTVDTQTVNFIAATFRCVTAEGVAGQPKVDVAANAGSAITAASGVQEVKVASLANNAITAASIADDAIDLATFAADAKALMGVVAFGTAQAATGTTLQLAASSAFADDELNGCTVLIRSATAGAGQARVITNYTSTTDTAEVDTWTTTPTGTITYIVFGTAPSSTSVPLVANVTQWGGAAVATPTVAGVPEVDVTHWIGTAAATPTTAGVPEVDITHIGGTAVTAAAGIPEVKVASIANNAITANSINADAITDAKVAADVTIASVTGAVGSVSSTVNADVKKINAVTITGTGVLGDEFKP